MQLPLQSGTTLCVLLRLAPPRLAAECLQGTLTPHLCKCLLPIKLPAPLPDVDFTAQGVEQPKPTSHYLPLDLWSLNVGSQVGLDEALNQINAFYEDHCTTAHSYGVVDINIFYRYYLVHTI